MARADLILNLVQAGQAGDQSLFRRTVEAMVAEERAKQHHVLADRLAEKLKCNGTPSAAGPRTLATESPDLLLETVPERELSDLVLPSNVGAACDELIEEHRRADLLRSHSLEPRHRIILAGPPGNGKTSLAEALASALMVPLLVVRYEVLIGSYLGETAQRLRRVFDHARTRRCVLFFDEFDAIGKERGDLHETGEIKRVVSSLLLQIDALPSYVIVVAASNHPELLDRAVWRRFQLRLELPQPTRERREEWLRRFEERTRVSLGMSPRTLADQLKDASFAEIEEFGLDIVRRSVLARPDVDARSIVRTRLEQWRGRFRASDRLSE